MLMVLCTLFIHINIIPTRQKIHLIWTEYYSEHNVYVASMCSLVVSILDSPAVDPRSNPGSGSALWWVKISGCILHLQLSYANRQSALQWLIIWSLVRGWLATYCSKRDALSSNRKVAGSRLTGSTQACLSWYGNRDTGDGIASARN